MGGQPVKIPLVGKILHWWGEKRIARMKALVASVPEGRELIALAEREKAVIVFDRGLFRRTLAAEIRNPLPREGETIVIALNPWLPGRSLALSFAHELRHLWQTRQLNDPAKIRHAKLQDIMSFKRLMEADAFVFQNYMAVKIFDATGKRMPWHSGPDRSMIDEWLAPLAPPPKDAGSPAALKKAFNAFMASGVAGRYDRESLQLINGAAAWFAKNGDPAKPLQEKLREQFNLASFREVADVAKIPVIGTGENALRYLDETDTDKLMADIWQLSRSPAANALRKKYSLG